MLGGIAISVLSLDSSKGVFAKVPINLLFAHLIITFQFGNQCKHAPTFNKPRKPEFIPNLLQFYFFMAFSMNICVLPVEEAHSVCSNDGSGLLFFILTSSSLKKKNVVKRNQFQGQDVGVE